jgi:hypothetical protein
MKKYIFIVLVALISCSPYSDDFFSQTGLDYLRINKNMSVTYYKHLFNLKNTNSNSFYLDSVKYEYFIQHFYIPGNDRFVTNISHPKFPYNYIIPYFFVFKNDKFFYCGFLYEFKLNQNYEIRKISRHLRN